MSGAQSLPVRVRREVRLPLAWGTNATPSWRSPATASLLLKDLECPADTSWGWHQHAGPTTFLLLEGSYAERLASQTFECEPYAVTLKPAGEGHANRTGTSGARGVLVEFAATTSDSLGWLSAIARPRLVRAPGTAALGLEIARELRLFDEDSRLALEGLLFELLARVHRGLRRGERRSPRWLVQAREYLHGNATRPIQLAAVAVLLGVHPSHLARVFRRQYGCTIGEYSRRLRMQAAADLLRTSSSSIAAVADLTGWSDQSHLTRLFRRYYGMTPHQYRRAGAGGGRGALR